jgi:hypothetical protein
MNPILKTALIAIAAVIVAKKIPVIQDYLK